MNSLFKTYVVCVVVYTKAIWSYMIINDWTLVNEYGWHFDAAGSWFSAYMVHLIIGTLIFWGAAGIKNLIKVSFN
ncbi:hypothetical protein [Sanyastnella coralliicola]|uniref:hypothetical protein n=1 Tax=Sanyastnella coralliicola TaxID=3069118 RepID=UPI0027B95CFD|nr:hypothetical protein [Longitalea sp. SCSIO 12813]